MQSRVKICRRLLRCAFVFIVFFSEPPAFGKDLEVLVRILYIAFAGDQMSAICSSAPKVPLSNEDKNILLGAHLYSNMIKDHVTAGLEESDIENVVKSAADLAAVVTQTEILRLGKYTAEQLPAATIQWCTEKVEPLIAQTTGAYNRNRDEIEKMITKAKAD